MPETKSTNNENNVNNTATTKKLKELMNQAESLRAIPMEGSYEWFDDIIPKIKRLLQQIQREQMACSQYITTEMFNQVRDCCSTLERHLQHLDKTRRELESQKDNVIKSEMNRMSIHNGAYSSFRGFFGN